MRRIITPERMRALEAAFMEKSGTPGLVLMERAARAVADAVLAGTDGGALFLCGPGNNGGDGYAAARLVREAGRGVWIWALSDPDALAGDALTNMRRCEALRLPVRKISEMPAAPPEGCGIVVDALFGTGLTRPLAGLYARAVDWINSCGLKVLAVDMPSGTPGRMARADATVTFHRRKPCHLLLPGRVNAGAVTVADIGIPDGADPDDFEWMDASDVQTLLPPRPVDAHKGTCGHALIVAGSPGMAGAAALCAGGALRGGAGLVTVCCPESVLPVVQMLAPCAMCVAHADFSRAVEGKSAVAAGPGLGRGEAADAILRLLREARVPQVWDADALNWLAERKEPLGERHIITPHPGEAARLLGCGAREVAEDPVWAARRLREAYGAVALVKGATTVIAGEGQKALNTSGTQGLSTGGSGDVLTGLIAALLAQGLAPFDAARLGAFLHGKAGETAAKRQGVRSMTAQDLLAAIRID
ncbi:MAG: NAD(P)H-hydrate dehydratase [Firmicutes bacterium]|nr:NAD(P)H-hydrate dehydratase [Bacillota bacterium]